MKKSKSRLVSGAITISGPHSGSAKDRLSGCSFFSASSFTRREPFPSEFTDFTDFYQAPDIRHHQKYGDHGEIQQGVEPEVVSDPALQVSYSGPEGANLICRTRRN